MEVRLEVTDSEGKAVRNFSSGEPVHLRLALTNRGDAAVSLPFSSTKTHDAIVRRADGSEVWRWSAGRMFAQVISELALPPGGSEAFEASCDPRRQGQPVLPPGSYEVVGVIPAMGSELRSAPVSFEVE